MGMYVIINVMNLSSNLIHYSLNNYNGVKIDPT